MPTADPQRLRVRRRARYPAGVIGRSVAVSLILAVLAGCSTTPQTTPAITPGTATRPRDVIIVAKDYTYLPPVVDLVPGESVVFQIVNGGLAVHEIVVGQMAVQDAWEAAEAAAINTPPGPTPQVSVAPDLAGLRVVVASGQRVDVAWTVPAVAATTGPPWLVGCHIPGHWAEGMVVPIRFAGPDGRPLPTGSQAATP